MTLEPDLEPIHFPMMGVALFPHHVRPAAEHIAREAGVVGAAAVPRRGSIYTDLQPERLGVQVG
jgi:hypothetical protein